MARFEYQKKQHTYRKFIISVCVFLLIVLLFYQGIESLSSGSVRRQRESLENALNRSINLPVSLEQIEISDEQWKESMTRIPEMSDVKHYPYRVTPEMLDAAMTKLKERVKKDE